MSDFDVLRKLVDKKIITMDDVLEHGGVDLRASARMTEIATAMHNFLCPLVHGQEEGCCRFFLEEGLEGYVWTMPAHKIWLENAVNLRDTLELDEEVFFDCFMKAVRLLREFMRITSGTQFGNTKELYIFNVLVGSSDFPLALHQHNLANTQLSKVSQSEEQSKADESPESDQPSLDDS